MTRLPVVSAQDALTAFRKRGYEVDHQTGSHIILRNTEIPHRRLTIPNHKELAKGTLRALMELPEDKSLFIMELNQKSVPTRYPEDLQRMMKEFSKKKTEEVLKESRELLTWIKAQYHISGAIYRGTHRNISGDTSLISPISIASILSPCIYIQPLFLALQISDMSPELIPRINARINGILMNKTLILRFYIQQNRSQNEAIISALERIHRLK